MIDCGDERTTDKERKDAHAAIIAKARSILSDSNGEITIAHIAKHTGFTVQRVRCALEAEGYEFSLNVAESINGLGSRRLPVSEWTVEWNPSQSPIQRKDRGMSPKEIIGMAKQINDAVPGLVWALNNRFP